MDPELSRILSEDAPKLNEALAQGLAYQRMKEAARYVDRVMQSAAASFPEGLHYVRCAPCLPGEEYAQAIRKSKSRRGMRRKKTGKSFDMARSDVYLMKYIFKFDNPQTGQTETLDPVYLYLPFCSPGGVTHINGSRFTIAPVLADRVISISNESIFVRILRDRITFHRMDHTVDIDGVHEQIKVVHSMIHHNDGRKQKLKRTVTANTCMMHYLLCKYGFTETFRRFCDCVPVVGVKLNRADFPESDWVICRSVYVGTDRRMSRRRGPTYAGLSCETIELAFRREEFTSRVQYFVGGFFYVFDHLPFLMRTDWIDDLRQWRVMMGHILWSGDMDVGELYNRVSDHISSLDEYVDAITRAQMQDIGLNVKDIYEFFAIIMEKFNAWYLEGVGRINSMYDKELMVLYYVLLGVSKAIFGFAFDVTAASKKGLTKDAIVKAIQKNLRQTLILQMNRMSEIVSSTGYSGDNMAFKITGTMVPQSASARGPGRGPNQNGASDDSSVLHVSVAEIGSYSSMTKKDPSGRSRLNLAALTDHKDVVRRNPMYQELLEEAQRILEMPYRGHVDLDTEEFDDVETD